MVSTTVDFKVTKYEFDVVKNSIDHIIKIHPVAIRNAYDQKEFLLKRIPPISMGRVFDPGTALSYMLFNLSTNDEKKVLESKQDSFLQHFLVTNDNEKANHPMQVQQQKAAEYFYHYIMPISVRAKLINFYNKSRELPKSEKETCFRNSFLNPVYESMLAHFSRSENKYTQTLPEEISLHFIVGIMLNVISYDKSINHEIKASIDASFKDFLADKKSEIELLKESSFTSTSSSATSIGSTLIIRPCLTKAKVASVDSPSLKESSFGSMSDGSSSSGVTFKDASESSISSDDSNYEKILKTIRDNFYKLPEIVESCSRRTLSKVFGFLRGRKRTTSSHVFVSELILFRNDMKRIISDDVNKGAKVILDDIIARVNQLSPELQESLLKDTCNPIKSLKRFCDQIRYVEQGLVKEQSALLSVRSS